MRSVEWLCCWWPWVTLNSPNHPIFAFFVAFHIFVVGQRRHFKFGTQVGHIASPSILTTSSPRKGRGYVTWPILNLEAPSISQEWLKLEMSNFVYQVLPKEWKITPKTGVVMVTWPIWFLSSPTISPVWLVAGRGNLNNNISRYASHC